MLSDQLGTAVWVSLFSAWSWPKLSALVIISSVKFPEAPTPPGKLLAASLRSSWWLGLLARQDLSCLPAVTG